MIRAIGLFLALYAFWLLLSGLFTPFLLLAGAGCAGAVVWLTRRLRVVDEESLPLQLGWRIVVYWIWLGGEIVRSALQVSRIILDPKLPISPSLVSFKPSQRSAVGLVVHANSITLTPGTITVEAGVSAFLVHGLTREGAQGCVDSAMDRRVSACEGEA